MVRHRVLETQPTEPPIRQIQMDLFAQSALGANAKAVTDDQHPHHQLGIDRRPSRVAVRRRAMTANNKLIAMGGVDTFAILATYGLAAGACPDAAMAVERCAATPSSSTPPPWKFSWPWGTPSARAINCTSRPLSPTRKKGPGRVCLGEGARPGPVVDAGLSWRVASIRGQAPLHQLQLPPSRRLYVSAHTASKGATRPGP